jgi:hypothetical protein
MHDRTIVALYHDIDIAMRALGDLEGEGLGEAFTLLGNASAKAAAGLAGENEAGRGFASGYRVVYDSTGSRVDTLKDLGVPEDEAHAFAEAVRRGAVVVIGRLDNVAIERALAVMDRYRPVDLDERVRAYQDAGWTRYDPAAADYDADRARAEWAGVAPTGTREAAAGIRDVNDVPLRSRVRSYAF